MKVFDFGSLNIDHTYQMQHFVRAGETLSSAGYARNAGGKGFNQAIALCRAGCEVTLVGAIGRDGLFLRDMLTEAGADTSCLAVLDVPTGHAIIQVDEQGENAILLYGGANRCMTPDMVNTALAKARPGDLALLQNEINGGADIVRLAHEAGLTVVLNPSPITAELKNWPLELVDWMLLNEVEGCELTGQTESNAILDELLRRCPGLRVVLTLGEGGAVYADAGQRVRQRARRVRTADTTAAGDTFTGYFLSSVMAGETVAQALQYATQAAAIAVSRPGAAASIPEAAEVKDALAVYEAQQDTQPRRMPLMQSRHPSQWAQRVRRPAARR